VPTRLYQAAKLRRRIQGNRWSQVFFRNQIDESLLLVLLTDGLGAMYFPPTVFELLQKCRIGKLCCR
jgi:hypothetical protein